MDANHQIVSDNKASSVRWRPRWRGVGGCGGGGFMQMNRWKQMLPFSFLPAASVSGDAR